MKISPGFFIFINWASWWSAIDSNIIQKGATRIPIKEKINQNGETPIKSSHDEVFIIIIGIAIINISSICKIYTWRKLRI
jgi:hypothetical protein